nr:MAG TPA: hypothetical protein [Caudoviricetes sp.]
MDVKLMMEVEDKNTWFTECLRTNQVTECF